MFELTKECNVHAKTNVFDFGESLEIWWIKPHVANRRLAGTVSFQDFEFDYGLKTAEQCLECISNVIKHMNFQQKETLITSSSSTGDGAQAIHIRNYSDSIGGDKASTTSDMSLDLLDFKRMFNPVLTYFCGSVVCKNSVVKCSIRKLLPRSQDLFSSTYELMLRKMDHSRNAAMFIPLYCDHLKGSLLISKTYLICFDEISHVIQLSVHKDFQTQETPPSSLVASISWLTETLLHKLGAWTEAASISERGLRKEQSLSLIDVEAYTSKYSELKKKYGPYFVKIWPESTDALKFVYEDIGIATYLLILWEKEREELGIQEKQSFVDLGCGNGLLVHILANEGHPGRGIDINRRKIWNLYDDKTVLEEKSLIPNQFTVEEDWIIGNHSDELTPWIPVIAARSSSHTRYFVLPCCFFDFNSKFHHIDHKKSHYECYLEYIRGIGDKCQFKVQQDTLRIPSTKRVCQIGTTRFRSEEIYKNIDDIIERLLSCASEHLSQNAEIFTPRTNEVAVKNCGRIKESTKTDIIDKITSRLLLITATSSSGFQNDDHENNVTSRNVPWSRWNSGGSVHLNDLVKLLDPETLVELKSQCGGLQTLLKNNRNVFKVIRGMVQLRDYRKAEDLQPSRRSAANKNKTASAAERIKTKLCWFHVSHPQGCLFTSEQCTYAHGIDEIRAP